MQLYCTFALTTSSACVGKVGVMGATSAKAQFVPVARERRAGLRHDQLFKHEGLFVRLRPEPELCFGLY